ncbi:hypothetical protein PILCRDRAFT_327743 [Piloderma croceum F 1598]|uniref:Uncharacterized protein n=1 Tax=Piloderma croceum (strain F 1598) TaxID=765440 RepID=A0A0C3FQR3_PILCF|nr:hypothetical protein PILCRDRAFT_327743 [Piloderma croceum F 1598]
MMSLARLNSHTGESTYESEDSNYQSCLNFKFRTFAASSATATNWCNLEITISKDLMAATSLLSSPRFTTSWAAKIALGAAVVTSTASNWILIYTASGHSSFNDISTIRPSFLSRFQYLPIPAVS